MSDIIQLSSGEEENEGIPVKVKLKSNGSAMPKSNGPESAVDNTASAGRKEKHRRVALSRIENDQDEDMDCDGDTGESWSTFRKFLKICHDIEVTQRKGDPKMMQKILDKLSHRFKNAVPDYTQSDAFRNAVRSAQKRVISDPSNLFVHMKEVGDELKLRCIKEKSNNLKRKPERDEEKDHSSNKHCKMAASDVSEDQGEEDGQINKVHCKKLELLFEKVYRKVKKLEEKEVDWDAEENSEYLRLERYKKRLYAIWAKWKEASGKIGEVKRLNHQKIPFSGTKHPILNQAIEKYLSKTKCFPDFIDVYKLTSETLNKNVDFTEDQLKSIASEAFLKLGNQLQKMRVYEFWNCCLTYLPSSSDNGKDLCDPADQNEELAKALRENKKMYREKLSEVIDSFVAKQVDGKHEPKEVVLKTDDENSAPSEDEEEEKEEEEDDPEDIIYISSSSSEESDSETKSITKVSQNNRDGVCSNGNLAELRIKKKSSSDSESVHPADYIPLHSSSNKKSASCSGKVKMEAGEGPSKVEIVEPSLSGQKNSKSSSANDFSRKKKSKAGGNLEIVVLSESDSGD